MKELLTPQEVEQAQICARFLREGRVILLPTDTIWGLSCGVSHRQAVERIFEIKRRPPDRPFILLVSSVKMLKNYVEEIPMQVLDWLRHYSKPVSVVYTRVKNLPEWAKNSNGTAAIRICKNPFTALVVELVGEPVVSTSANTHGEPPPQTFQDISTEIVGQVDYTPTVGRELWRRGTPSMLVRIDASSRIEILRE